MLRKVRARSLTERCLTYVDLNMMRAGAVRHPEEWTHGGYHEIQGTRRRNTIIDLKALAEILEFDRLEDLRVAHKMWIDDTLRDEALKRDDIWSQSLAVGSAEFGRQAQTALGHQGRYRNRLEGDGVRVLRETEESYGPLFGGGNEAIKA